MTCNVGKFDRAFRLFAGVAILGAGWHFQSWFGLLGIIPIFTGLTRWCPAYIPFKINTCSADEKKTQAPQ
jgi:hypothetical protein